ncbi:MAG: hypothetical protein ACKVRO_06105 [Micropepsaceae bacterium]
MSLLAAAALFIPTINAVPATAHERSFQTKIEQVAQSDLPLSIWRANGTHLQSTLVCPANAGNFERVQLVPFDNHGFDVGCNFDYRGESRITLYLTRRKAQSLADDLQIAKDALKQNMTSAQLIEGATAAPTGLPFTGAIYSVSGSIRTAVWVADVAGWTMKFRATYRTENEPGTIAAITSLAEGAKKTAGAHLVACAAAPTVVRDGKEITDKDRIMSLSLMAGILDATADVKDVKPAEQWCAEEATGDKDTPILFWRNIAGGGNAGPMDRMSLMTMGEPPTLVSTANPTASLIEDEAGKGKGLIHQLTEQRGDTTYVFTYFEGRPAAATLSPVAKDIFLDKRNPISSYNSKTNTITVPSGS